MTKQSSLRPKITLSDLYDSNIVYTSRPSYISNPWLEPEEHQSNFLTGRELLIANQMPVIVHEASLRGGGGAGRWLGRRESRRRLIASTHTACRSAGHVRQGQRRAQA